MQARYGVDAYNFFPETFHLPNDLNLLKSAWEADEEKCWIIKPVSTLVYVILIGFLGNIYSEYKLGDCMIY